MLRVLLRVIRGVVGVLPPRLQEWLMGAEDPTRRGVGLLWVGLALLTGVAAATGLYTLTTGLETRVSSGPLVRYTFAVATNTWTYLVVVLLISRSVLLKRDDIKARYAAEATGVSGRTVKRLAAEISSSSGTKRAVIASSDTVEDARETVVEKLDGGQSDVPRWKRETSDSDGTNPGGDADESTGTGNTNETGVNPSKTDASTVDEPDEVWGDDGTEDEVTNDTDNDGSDDDDAGTAGGVREDLTARERVKAWQMDTAAALNWDDVIWYALAPAAAVAAGVLLLLGIWVHPVIAAGVVCGAAGIGALNLLRIRRKRVKVIGLLSEERSLPPIDLASVLLKRVDTPEMTVYMAWIGGKRYASPDRDEFVNGVAERALQYARGDTVAPSIMTRYARELEAHRPDLASYRDFEEHRVARALVDAVDDHRILPRGMLVEMGVEDGIRDSSLLAPEVELGHDPRIVHDMYDLLTPEVLVEEPVTVRDSDGTERDVTAVRLRGDPIAPEGALTEARFTNVFSSYTESGEETRYCTPAADHPREPAIRVQPVDLPADEDTSTTGE